MCRFLLIFAYFLKIFLIFCTAKLQRMLVQANEGHLSKNLESSWLISCICELWTGFSEPVRLIFPSNKTYQTKAKFWPPWPIKHHVTGIFRPGRVRVCVFVQILSQTKCPSSFLHASRWVKFVQKWPGPFAQKSHFWFDFETFKFLKIYIFFQELPKKCLKISHSINGG